ncbi:MULTISPECIES: hypothetical protein [Bradyrhizobium]|jgi:hypothetical protein|nr:MULTISPECIES: hypothetical protein [Bradyrhizobium]
MQPLPPRGLSPYVTQRMVSKLASLIDGAGLPHLVFRSGFN